MANEQDHIPISDRARIANIERVLAANPRAFGFKIGDFPSHDMIHDPWKVVAQMAEKVEQAEAGIEEWKESQRPPLP